MPADVARRLREVGRSADGTLFTALVAACQVLFHRWSGQDDFAIGTVACGGGGAAAPGRGGVVVKTHARRG
ncbi:hypothetical protein K7G98_37285, partial [Saccharothrix sp. MB29]|nr:hypothetical protein [Saccharothrix sp. MB29]